MSDTLAERLAERLDIQPEQTDRLVRTLAQLIKTQASRDGQVRVPGLGVFEQRAEALSFEPDPHFATTVNPKYAHLPTVSVATLAPPVDGAVDEPGAVVDQEESEAQGDTAPVFDVGDVDLPTFAPPVETEAISEEEDSEEGTSTSFFEEDAPADTDIPEDRAYDLTPPPLPDEAIEQDIFEAPTDEEEEPVAEDDGLLFDEPEIEDESLDADEEVSFFDEPDVEEEDKPIAADEDFLFGEPDQEGASDREAEPVFTEETTWGKEADQDDEDSIVSLMTEEPADQDDEDAAFPEEPFDSEDRVDVAELFEDDTYAALEEESAQFEEDTFLEESEPSAWAPPGTRWTGENKDQLAPIEGDETEDDTTPPPPIEEANLVEEAFAAAPLQAVPKAALEEPRAAADDLPPRPSPRIRPYPQEPASTSRSVWPWLLAALFFVVIAGGAYYYFNLREQPLATNDPPPAEQPNLAEDPAVTPPGDETQPEDPDPTNETDTPPDNGTEGQDEQSPPSEEATSDPAPTGPIDRAQGGYTLVVGSRGSRAAAEADAERVRQAVNDTAIPVDVLQGTVGGTTRYRIGVGQVETTDAALALKQRLGNRITADAWVTRILPDS